MKFRVRKIAGGVVDCIIEIQRYADDHGLEVEEIQVTPDEWRDLLQKESVFDPAASLTSALEGKAVFLGIPITRETK